MIGEIFSAGWPNCIYQGTICIAAGLIVSFFLRQRSSRAHQVLFLAMIAAVVVPTMSAIVRHHELGIFVSRPAVTYQSDPAPLLSNYYIMPISLPVGEQPYVPPIDNEFSLSAAVSPIKVKLPTASVLTWSWIIVSAIMASRLLMTFVLGIRLLRSALPLSCHKLRKALCVAKDNLGVDKPVELYASRRVSSPVIWCWSRKLALLVPDDADQFDDSADWVGMFCHELAHYRRLDHITGLLAELMVCAFPWHPLMWWARRRLAGLSEQACDDWVVASGRSAEDYAESLLDLSPQGQLALLPAVVGRKKGLENRVRRIVKDKCGNPRLGLCWTVLVSIAAACITIGAAFAQARPADTEKVKKADADEVKEVEDEVWRTAKEQLIAEQQQLEQLAEKQLERRLQIEKLAQMRDELQEQVNQIMSDIKSLQQQEKANKQQVESEFERLSRDQLMQYKINMLKLADDLKRRLEERKDYQDEKAKLHDRMRATIEGIDKTQQHYRSAVSEEPVGLDTLRQTTQRDQLMRFKRELQAVRDRTKSSLEGLPEEADNLRDKLKEIEAIIQNIDSQLQGPVSGQVQGLKFKNVPRQELVLTQRRQLEDRANQIQRKLKEAPGAAEVEKLQMELDQVLQTIDQIDNQILRHMRQQQKFKDDQPQPEWCPEKRKTTRMAKPKPRTDAGRVTERPKTAPSCSSCHESAEHPELEPQEVLPKPHDAYGLEVHRKPRAPVIPDVEAQSTEWRRKYVTDLNNRKSEWQAEMRAFAADVVAAKVRVVDANATLENDQATLKDMELEIKRFTLENQAKLGTDIALYNKLQTMKTNYDTLARKVQQDRGVLEKYKKLLEEAERRKKKYEDYRPPTGIDPIHPSPARRERATTRQPVLRSPAGRMPRVPTTAPQVWPTEPGRPSPEQAEKLQRRVNQLQDEMTRLRNEIAEMRRLLTDLVAHEKKRPDQPPTDIKEDLLGQENKELR